MIRRVLVLLAVGSVLVVALPGTPVQLSYVYSDSMEPTIGTGDGYVVVPAGDVSVGDVLVFDSDYRGEYVTHRVVDVTEAGYVTQGDANPATDQATGHPVVTSDRVVGQVLTLGDRPVVIPGLASVVSLLSTYWPLGVLAVLLGGGLLERNPRARDLVRVDDLITPLVLTTVVGSAIALAYSAPTYTMAFTAVATDADGGRVLPLGEAVSRTIEVAAGPRYTYQFVEGTGVTIADVAANGDVFDVVVDVPARAERGAYDATVTTYYYPAVLPYGLVRALHAFHPVTAALATIGTVVAPAYAVHRLAVDGRAPIESRSRSRTAWWDPR
ncbi:signal peptidase, endoplasmic reticulum-type [Halolamina pelagica]|uniref:Signal peptidase, endoplasmic reticulum-type n=2 Tax=Haloferacaceae TaxID=1644056 RepID=A0A1I5TR54_9EURY|nr:signal peptidase, endoplasmic reticulum-type [Halolamina pelagica]